MMRQKTLSLITLLIVVPSLRVILFLFLPHGLSQTQSDDLNGKNLPYVEVVKPTRKAMSHDLVIPASFNVLRASLAVSS